METRFSTPIKGSRSVGAGEIQKAEHGVGGISEQREPATPAEKELFNEQAAKLGEWEAMQRHAERAGATRMPPDDWAPKDPGLLLLPEQRATK